VRFGWGILRRRRPTRADARGRRRLRRRLRRLSFSSQSALLALTTKPNQPKKTQKSAGAAVTSALAYKEAGRTLRAEGVDPRARRAVLPLALRAALGSLALTAGVAWGGFWLLREYGAVGDAPAALPTPGEAWDALFRSGGAGRSSGGQGEGGARATAAPAMAPATAPATAGDGSTLRALSAAWQRRQGSVAAATTTAVVVPEEERQPAVVEDTSKRRDQGRRWWFGRAPP
jgi:hypothetical protein